VSLGIGDSGTQNCTLNQRTVKKKLHLGTEVFLFLSRFEIFNTQEIISTHLEKKTPFQ